MPRRGREGRSSRHSGAAAVALGACTAPGAGAAPTGTSSFRGCDKPLAGCWGPSQPCVAVGEDVPGSPCAPGGLLGNGKRWGEVPWCSACCTVRGHTCTRSVWSGCKNVVCVRTWQASVVSGYLPHLDHCTLGSFHATPRYCPKTTRTWWGGEWLTYHTTGAGQHSNSPVLGCRYAPSQVFCTPAPNSSCFSWSHGLHLPPCKVAFGSGISCLFFVFPMSMYGWAVRCRRDWGEVCQGRPKPKHPPARQLTTALSSDVGQPTVRLRSTTLAPLVTLVLGRQGLGRAAR